MGFKDGSNIRAEDLDPMRLRLDRRGAAWMRGGSDLNPTRSVVFVRVP
jgi:hypothetical protein